jgi:hypothetical protein
MAELSTSEIQKLRHRSVQKLKEWGYFFNEDTAPRKCCGNCQNSRIMEHIERFYPEVFCELTRNLNLSDEVEYLGLCNRYKLKN